MSRLFSWTLNIVYSTVLVLASPWIVWSAFKYGKYREGFAQKFWGQVPRRAGDRRCVWLHAVSVGEVNLLATLLTELANCAPDLELVISTTTKAGYDLACKKYSTHKVFYCPLDFSWAVSRALRRIRPDLLILAELELWPNLIVSAKGQGTRVAIVNGRLSDRSFRGYLRFRTIVSRVLSNLDLIAAQNHDTAERFCRLGAVPSAVHATGSLKFDGAGTNRNNQQTRRLRELANFSADDVIFLAGSTQSPEEEIALRVFCQLAVEHPRLKLVLVPRHPQRFDEVAHLLANCGMPWRRRSQIRLQDSNHMQSILLIDTVGELSAWWGVADVGFVGGSFGSRGGQNMLEPAAYGVATCFGANTWNFRDIVSQLLAVEGAVIVRDEAELSEFVRSALTDRTWAGDLGQRAQQFVLSQQGATKRTIELLLPLVQGNFARQRAA